MKKFLSATLGGALLLLGAGAAQALTFTSTASNLRGTFLIDQFGTINLPPTGTPPGFTDPNPGTFHIHLDDLMGSATFNVPPPGHYGVYLNGTSDVDYFPQNPGPPPWDIHRDFSNFLAYKGDIAYTGITGSQFVYDFDNDVFTSDGNPITGGSFSASAASFSPFFTFFLGFPILTGIGGGTVDVVYTVGADYLDVTLTERDLVGWYGFENFLRLLDAGYGNPPLPGGNNDGEIDGRFQVNGTLTAIPEPASLTLLGIGLASLGVIRRQKKAA